MLVMTGERDDEATMALLDWLLEEQLPGGTRPKTPDGTPSTAIPPLANPSDYTPFRRETPRRESRGSC